MVPSHFPTLPKRPLPYDTLPGALPGPPSRWHCALGWPWPPAVPRPRRKGRPKGRHRGWTPFESSWDRADFWGFENWKSAASRLRYGAMQGLRMQLGYRKVGSLTIGTQAVHQSLPKGQGLDGAKKKVHCYCVFLAIPICQMGVTKEFHHDVFFWSHFSIYTKVSTYIYIYHSIQTYTHIYNHLH